MINAVKRNPSNLKTFLLKRLVSFSAASVLNSPVQTVLKRNLYSLESNTLGFNSPKNEAPITTSTETSAFLARATSKKALVMKDLDWKSQSLDLAETLKPKKPRFKPSLTLFESSNSQLKIDQGYSSSTSKGCSKTTQKTTEAKRKMPLNMSAGEQPRSQRSILRREDSLPEEEAQKGPWIPIKRISRASMDEIRSLAEKNPKLYTIPKLSAKFKISYEAVKRILKSKFKPTPEIIAHQEERRKRQQEFYLKSLKETANASLLTSNAPNFYMAPLSLEDGAKKSLNITSKGRGATKEQSGSNFNDQPKISAWIPTGENEGWDNL